MNSEKSAELFEMIGDPINGALWSGPPFKSQTWRSFTDARNEGSPQWLPEFRDSRLVRFMNQNGTTVPAGRPWGPMQSYICNMPAIQSSSSTIAICIAAHPG